MIQAAKEGRAIVRAVSLADKTKAEKRAGAAAVKAAQARKKKLKTIKRKARCPPVPDRFIKFDDQPLIYQAQIQAALAETKTHSDYWKERAEREHRDEVKGAELAAEARAILREPDPDDAFVGVMVLLIAALVVGLTIYFTW